MMQRMMELARTLGRVSDHEEELLITLCSAAGQELTGTLREGVTPEDCPEAFALAGAWLALAGLEVSRCAQQKESFSAGDVTIRPGDPNKKAQTLREQAKRLMAGWTKRDNFLFSGVRGI